MSKKKNKVDKPKGESKLTLLQHALFKDEEQRAKRKPLYSIGITVVCLALAYVAMATGHPLLGTFFCCGGISVGVGIMALL